MEEEINKEETPMASANIKDTHASERRAGLSTRPPRIIGRTRGRRHGPITRLMSPGDLSELLKPFVFLDLFDMDEVSFPGIGLHPHSGIDGDMPIRGQVENVYLAHAPRPRARTVLGA